MNFLYINIGNSNIHLKFGEKIAVFAHQEPSDFYQQIINNFIGVDSLAGVILVSVVPQKSAIIQDICEKNNWQLSDLHRFRHKIPIENLTESPDKTGIDRLVNGMALINSPSPSLIIDCGTAITFDFFAKNADKWQFHGGLIIAGASLMNKALHHYTALLPLVDLNAKATLIGTNTYQAIGGGIHAAVKAILNHISAQYITQYGVDNIILTGGGAQYYLDSCEFPMVYMPNLTFNACEYFAKNCLIR